MADYREALARLVQEPAGLPPPPTDQDVDQVVLGYCRLGMGKPQAQMDSALPNDQTLRGMICVNLNSHSAEHWWAAPVTGDEAKNADTIADLAIHVRRQTAKQVGIKRLRPAVIYVLRNSFNNSFADAQFHDKVPLVGQPMKLVPATRQTAAKHLRDFVIRPFNNVGSLDQTLFDNAKTIGGLVAKVVEEASK